MSQQNADLLRAAAHEMRVEGRDSDPVITPWWDTVADFLDFAAGFAGQPQPYSPTVDHALEIARAYLGRTS